MADQNNPKQGQETERGSDIREHAKTLTEKTSDLDESLDGVEESLREASGEVRRSG